MLRDSLTHKFPALTVKLEAPTIPMPWLTYPLILGFLLSTQAAKGQTGTSADVTAVEAFTIMGHLNSPSALEPASCHGSIGTDLGAGLESFVVPGANSLLLEQLALNPADGNKSLHYYSSRIWLTKGLPLPIDLGLSAALPVSGLSQVSGYVQWSIYQALARPALALRASYHQLRGKGSTQINSSEGEAVISYGFWRYLNIYGRAGLLAHRATLTLSQNQQIHLGLDRSDAEPDIRRSWVEADLAVGLKVTLWTPFVALTAEAHRSSDRDYTVKLSYLF